MFQSIYYLSLICSIQLFYSILDETTLSTYRMLRREIKATIIAFEDY